MANKTIYVKDETLWKKAQELGGKGGISAVVAEALQAFVQQKEREHSGIQRFSLAVGNETDEIDDAVGPTERIAFDGQCLVEGDYNMPEGGAFGCLPKVRISVYRTVGGNLVLVSEEAPDEPGIGESRHAAYRSLSELRGDPVLQHITPVKRAHLLDELRKALGEDWAVWID